MYGLDVCCGSEHKIAFLETAVISSTSTREISAFCQLKIE
jgi:hypothetical protein